MQFILSIIALAAVATALPATSQAADATGFTNYDGERVLISLPSGCTKKDLASESSQILRVSIQTLIAGRVCPSLGGYHWVLWRCCH